MSGHAATLQSPRADLRLDILILTASHLCRNPRVVKEATALGEAGYDVLVLSVSTHTRFEAIDQAMMQNAPFRRVTLDYTGVTFRSRWAAFCRRAGTYFARQACRYLRLDSAQSLGPAHALWRVARHHPAALTIVHTEIPIWIASRLLEAGRRVAADFEDWYSEDLLFNDRRARPLRLLRQVEGRVLRSACFSFTTSHAMSSALASRYRCNAPLVVRNSFPLQTQTRLDRPASGQARFVWFSQTVGPGRGLELFFAAWKKMRAVTEVHLIGDVQKGYVSTLRALTPEHLWKNIHFVAPLTPENLPLELTKYDIGLALEPVIPPNKNLTTSNKLFQYLNAGLAIVASHTLGQDEVFALAPGCGVALNFYETTAATHALDHLAGDAENLRRCQAGARAAAAETFNWEEDRLKLLGAVRSVVLPRTDSARHLDPAELSA